MRQTLIALAALSLAACGTAEEPADTAATGEPAMAEAPPAAASAAGETPTDATGYVTAAGAGDLFEIASSQLALEKSRTEGIREFAQMMIDHHRKTTADVTAAARAAGLSPQPPQLTSMQRDNMTALQAASGASFDRLYLDQQAQSHQMALALHRGFAQGGDTSQLQEVARTAVPVVEQHIAELQELSAS